MDEVREFRASLRALVRALDKSLAGKTAVSAVTTAQCHLLLEIAERGEGSVGEFADSLGLDQSTLSRTADSLVKLGLAEREPDPENRRRQILSLSKEGKKRAESINRLCDSAYGKVLSRAAGQKKKTMLEGLSILIAALEAEGEKE
jgi:DNA-binding MarR family transcriptional regulator